MMGERRVMQEALFYSFSLERRVPDNVFLRKIDRSSTCRRFGRIWGRTTASGAALIDPELMIRMLIVGYSFGIRSERRLCERPTSIWPIAGSVAWGLDGDVPNHRRFPNRHGRFRESDLLRKLFETVVARCMKEGVVRGEAFAVDASINVADAHRRRSVGKVEDLDPIQPGGRRISVAR